MNKFTKKAASVALSVTTVIWLTGASFAFPVAAQTSTADIQAQINALMATITALQAQLTAAGGSVTSTTYSFTRDLTLGSQGDDVKALQQYLNSTAYKVAASGVGSAGSESTYFGPLTKAAVAAWQAGNSVSPAVGYFGSISRAKYISLGGSVATTGTYPAGCTSAVGFSTTTGESCVTVTPTTYPAGCTSAVGFSPTTGTSCAGTTTSTQTPLSVQLDVATPVAANIQIGAANVTVTKVNFAAAADADTSISGLTVKSYGTATLNNQDIALVKIFDSGVQVGLSQGLVQGTAFFVFSPAISITKGTVKTLDIVVSMQVATAVPAPIPSSTVKMGIESAAKISGATFIGTFPVVGNAMISVAGGALGTLNVAQGAVVPVNQTYVGAKDVVLGNFAVSAGTNEDVNVSSFSANFGPLATVADTDITNVRVKVDGVLTGSSANFSSRRATVLFATVIPIVKGTSKAFQVIGDITSGALRNIELSAAIDAAAGVGATSGAGVAGPFVAINLGAANVIAVGAGTLAISVSTASPQGSAANIVRSSVPQVLGVYDIRAIGEDVLVTNVNITLADGALGTEVGTIGNVGLYDENGALLSQSINLTAVAADGINFWGPAAGTTFVMGWTIPANTTKKLYIKGTTNGITAPVAPATVTVTSTLVAVGGFTVVATGMSSSGQAGPNNITSITALALPPITVNPAGTFATVGNAAATPYSQNVLGPVSQVITGTLKITATNEDQRLRLAVLTGVPGGGAGNTATLVSSVALFDGATQITNFIAPAVNTVTYAAIDVLVPTTFTKGVSKTLDIVANVIAPVAVEGSTLRWTIAAAPLQLQTTGVISGTIADPALAVDTRVNVGAFNEGGTYTLRSNVLEMKKNAASPSGSIARGTFADVAKFDLESKGAGINLGVDTLVFASTTGLPAALTSSVQATGVLNDATLFRLFDVDGGINIPATRFLNVAAGTITFSGIANGLLDVNFGTPRHISLQATTTNPALWPAYASMQWGITTAASSVVGAMGTVMAAGNADLGTVVALQIAVGAGAAGVSGELRKTGGAGAAFVLGTDGAYLDSATAGVVGTGDVRIAIGNAAASGAGFTAGSVVAAGDADQVIGDAIALPTAVAGQLMKSGAAGALFVLGTDAAYIKTVAAGALIAGDTRLMYGNAIATSRNWQAGTGFGGATYSVPAMGNTVTIAP